MCRQGHRDHINSHCTHSAELIHTAGSLTLPTRAEASHAQQPLRRTSLPPLPHTHRTIAHCGSCFTHRRAAASAS